jgi:hypothetical protein
MTEQEAQTFIDLDEQDNVEYFGRYLGIDYEDFGYLALGKDIDFDDGSN